LFGLGNGLLLHRWAASCLDIHSANAIRKALQDKLIHSRRITPIHRITPDN
jgi:hypothetical protein